MGLGIPVIIDGSWSEPRIYPDMAGILDNPDAAYAKLKDMGKGLFGAGGLSGGLGGLGAALGGNGSGSTGGTDSGGAGPSGQLGKLGETLGSLLQQGFGSDRGIPQPNTASTPEPPPPATVDHDPPLQPSQNSQPMNDVLRQLFNR